MEEQLYIPFIKPNTTVNQDTSEIENTFTELCTPCERVFSTKEEMDTTIQAEFDAELLTHYNEEYDTDDETGTLIKIKRLTETYVTLFKKNVKHTPKSQSIIEHCEAFIARVKDRIRDVCDHVIEEDDVEIGLDRIAHIIYCNRCETLFN
jgi:hypothetical protein